MAVGVQGKRELPARFISISRSTEVITSLYVFYSKTLQRYTDVVDYTKLHSGSHHFILRLL